MTSLSFNLDKYSKLPATTFPLQMMDILEANKYSDIIEWWSSPKLPSETWGFIIYDTVAFENKIMPLYFPGAKYSSFTRRLRRWNFQLHKLSESCRRYWHPSFQRGDYNLAFNMMAVPQVRKRRRKNPKAVESQHAVTSYNDLSNTTIGTMPSLVSQNTTSMSTSTSIATALQGTTYFHPSSFINREINGIGANIDSNHFFPTSSLDLPGSNPVMNNISQSLLSFPGYHSPTSRSTTSAFDREDHIRNQATVIESAAMQHLYTPPSSFYNKNRWQSDFFAKTSTIKNSTPTYPLESLATIRNQCCLLQGSNLDVLPAYGGAMPNTNDALTNSIVVLEQKKQQERVAAMMNTLR